MPAPCARAERQPKHEALFFPTAVRGPHGQLHTGHGARHLFFELRVDPDTAWLSRVAAVAAAGLAETVTSIVAAPPLCGGVVAAADAAASAAELTFVQWPLSGGRIFSPPVLWQGLGLDSQLPRLAFSILLPEASSSTMALAGSGTSRPMHLAQIWDSQRLQ